MPDPNVTERNEALWSTLLDAAMDAIIAMDSEGRVVEFNAAAELMFGYARDEIVGEVMADLIVPEALRAGHRRGLRRYLETGEPRVMGQRLEMTGLRKDGTEFPVELTVTRVPVADPPLFAGQVRDITQRVLRQAEVERRLGQQRAVAELGRRAVAASGFEALAAPAAELAAEALGALAVHVYRDDGELLASAPAGADYRDHRWIESVAASLDSQSVADLETPGNGGLWGLGSLIQGADANYGTIVALVPEEHHLEGDELFLEAMANLLASAGDVAQALAELRTSRDQLEVIFRNVADAITVQAPDGTLTYANDAAAELLGFADADEMLAAEVGELMGRFEVMDEHHRPLPLDRLPGRRVLAGGQAEEAVVLYRVVATGEERWSRVRSSPVRDERGEVVLAINIVQDVTQARRAEEGARLLARVGEVLGSSLDLEATLVEVANLAVPEFADWAVVDLLDRDGTLRPVATAHVDPDKVELVAALRARRIFSVHDDVPGARVARTGASELISEIPDELLEVATDDPEELQLLRDLGLRSSLIVPMAVRGRVLGTLALAHAESGRRYRPEDLGLIEEVARRAAIAVDNARMYTERSYIAETLQQSLLPPYLPELPGLDVAVAFHAAAAGAEVGGDFYDVFRFDERRWGIVVGDVQGKGVEAATMVGLARHTLRAAALTASKPERVLAVLNRVLLEHDAKRLCTVAFILAEPIEEGVAMTVTVAGHPPPVLLPAAGDPSPVAARGTVLGVFSDVAFTREDLVLAEGDALVVYSDGIAARDQQPTEVACQVAGRIGGAGSAADIVAGYEEAIAKAQPNGAYDDVTLVVLAAQ